MFCLNVIVTSMKIKRLLIIIYLGPISNPMKLTAGFLSAGMKTLSLTFCAGGLKINKNSQLKFNIILCCTTIIESQAEVQPMQSYQLDGVSNSY